MQREEKQLEITLDSISIKLDNLKSSIADMIAKLESENQIEEINWPTFLDNFALISSHFTALTKIVSKHFGAIQNRTVLPLRLAPDPDELLLRITEGRLPVFSHDTCPDYLRTKPVPAAEELMNEFEEKASNIAPERATNVFNQHNDVVSRLLEIVEKAREEWDPEIPMMSVIDPSENISIADTHTLVAAVGMGKDLVCPMQFIQSNEVSPSTSVLISKFTPPKNSSVGSDDSPVKETHTGLKTNIKSGTQMHKFEK